MASTRNVDVSLEDLQMQVYITGGILGILLVICFLLIIVNLTITHKISKKISTDPHNCLEFRLERPSYCFQNPNIQPHEELSRRGFAMYNGNEPNLNQIHLNNKSSPHNSLNSLKTNSQRTDTNFVY